MSYLVLQKIDIDPLLRAHLALKGALIEAESELEKAGAIQYFEFCYELAWKSLRKILLVLGKQEINNPRAVFREAAIDGLIADADFWLLCAEQRNLTVHTYNIDVAQNLFAFLPQFEQNLSILIQNIKNLK